MSWENSKPGKRWIQDVLRSMYPNMRDSAAVLQIVPGGEVGEGDVKFWVELGASIMLDKPIVAIIDTERAIPMKLRRIADKVVDVSDCGGIGTPEAADRIAAAWRELEEEGRFA